jgi:hypothetical protein
MSAQDEADRLARMRAAEHMTPSEVAGREVSMEFALGMQSMLAYIVGCDPDPESGAGE